MGSQGGFGQSKEFLDLVKSIGETRSKSEEDRIILREIETIKRRILEPDIPRRKMKEYIIRLVYVEMLGHDASFGYIHAVKMAHDENLLHKRTGYLAVTLFLNEDHDLIILIVNTIQKDLKSDNYLVVFSALNAVCRLINEETIPAVLPQVVELLGHQKEAVRKKAIMTLHRFYQKSPSTVSHLISNFRKKLSDNDSGVMGASLYPLFDLITIDVKSYKDLVASFIKLLKILGLLGNGDKHASGQMYNVVGDLIRKCDASSNIGNAVLYECICCVASIYPSTKLLEATAEVIAKFLKNDNHNLKYMGIDVLGRLIKLSPDVTEQHQLAVIDCLEDLDDTLKRKTFELLHKMTKSSNVEVIVDGMIDYMTSINDFHYKIEIASRCVELAEQFAPSNHWFILTMNRIFEHAGDIVDIKVAHNLMRLIAKGFGGDHESADSQLRSYAVESYLHIVTEPKLPSAFLQVICWVLGEFGTADGNYSASNISGKLRDVAEAYSSDETVKAYAITALTKIYAFEITSGRKMDILPECQSLFEELAASRSADLQQRAYEFRTVVHLEAHAVKSIMPFDVSCEDIEVDITLPFLNSYVQQSLQNGAQPYIPEEQRSGTIDISNISNQVSRESSMHALKFEAYELPKLPAPSRPPLPVSNISTELVPVPEQSYSIREANTYPSIPSVSTSGPPELKLRLEGIQKKWGRPSYSSSPPSSSGVSPSTASEISQVESAASLSSRPQDNYKDLKKAEVKIAPEKQKLAASLFGDSSKSNKTTGTRHNTSRSDTLSIDKSTGSRSSVAPCCRDENSSSTTS
ncbi:hypothetical protein SAY86_027839 [Trapa natans]|uniref:AP-4 complex subunit epsilon n=1 Tax=Trapa natans TaxID=22666 RepID=A0AAN7RFJ7_TRANT|nr:hypothetical protein SAY86_027839 [Trapa natans]